jgi:hypothetical protein
MGDPIRVLAPGFPKMFAEILPECSLNIP